ncbi:MAG: family 16 glycosylhydrolase [Verrucomicrobiota bacterium]
MIAPLILRIFRQYCLPFALLCFFCFSFVIPVSAAPPPGHYLVWSDEFNGTSLDLSKWELWGGPIELANSTLDAVTVGGGNMTITTYTTNGNHYMAIISTAASLLVKYGYLESNIQFNDSPRVSSAFWLLSPNNNAVEIGDPSTQGNEVDIAEHRAVDINGNDISGSIQNAIHWDGYEADHKQVNNFPIGSGLNTGFHAYGFLWTATNQSFAIDNTTVYSPTVARSDRSEVIELSAIVNVNPWAGQIPPGGYGNFSTSTTKFVVDYVRYYAPTTTVFWTGASTAEWTNVNNWLAGRVPKTGDDVQFSRLGIGKNMTLKQNFTLGSLSIMEVNPFSLSGNTLTLNSGGIDMVSALNDASISSAIILGAPQSWKIGKSLALTVNGVVSGSGSLTKSGFGTVFLQATNIYTGTTTVSNGTLMVNGRLGANSVTVTGGKLGGTGSIAGPVVVKVGGTLAPGASIGTLAISNSLTLQPGSIISIEINKSAGTSDKIIGLTSANYGGTLLVANLSGTLAVGDAFKIFDALNYAGAFAKISSGALPPGLSWSTSTLNSDGKLRVMSAVLTNITAQRTGNQWNLSWPTSHTGWLLQMQTNTINVGLSNNWFEVAGSDLTNRFIFTINPTNATVFFRLVNVNDPTPRFARGDLAVLQVGNGVINASGAPISIIDFPTYGGPSSFGVALPTTGPNAFLSGSSAYNSSMTLSADGRSLVFVGYNSPALASGSIDSSTVPRAVGSLSALGVFTLNFATTTFSGGTIRSAVTDGSDNFWASGVNSGVVYLGNNFSSVTLANNPVATREMRLVNGNIYFTAAQASTGYGVMGFNGSPTSASTPTLVLNTAGIGVGNPSPKGFAFNADLTIAYVADNRSAANGGGIQRFNWNTNNATWNYAYTLGNTLTTSQQVWSMTADFSGANPVIYATTGEATMNHLVSVTDAGAGSAFSIIATAATGSAFRGVSFAP